MAIKQADLPKYQSLLEEKKEEISKQLNGLRKKMRKSLDEDRVYERNTGDPDSDFITESSELAKDELMVRNLEKTLRDIEDRQEHRLGAPDRDPVGQVQHRSPGGHRPV
jgi:hypothetical protein